MAQNIMRLVCFLTLISAWAQTGEVRDCQPCRFSLANGQEESVRFEWWREGTTRQLRAVLVGKQRLDIKDAEQLGPEETVFFDTPDIDFDGTPDLQVIVERGMPNATAMYWRYLKDAKRYEAVGAYPVFTLDAKRKTLTAYVKRGAAGRNSTKTVYAWRQGKLAKLPR